MRSFACSLAAGRVEAELHCFSYAYLCKLAFFCCSARPVDRRIFPHFTCLLDRYAKRRSRWGLKVATPSFATHIFCTRLRTYVHMRLRTYKCTYKEASYRLLSCRSSRAWLQHDIVGCTQYVHIYIIAHVCACISKEFPLRDA